MAKIDTLLMYGEDALANHYSITFPIISQMGTVLDNFTMRVKTVDIPAQEISTYDVWKAGRRAERVSGNNETSYDVEVTYRHDKHFRCYKGLTAWKQYIQDNVTGFMGSDSGVDGTAGVSTFRYPITIHALSNNTDFSIPVATWTLIGAFPKTIGDISFDDESGDPLEGSVTFSCVNIIYPVL